MNHIYVYVSIVIGLLAYLYMHAYVYMVFVKDWMPGSVARNILHYIKAKIC